jgi:hypothetical protein
MFVRTQYSRTIQFNAWTTHSEFDGQNTLFILAVMVVTSHKGKFRRFEFFTLLLIKVSLRLPTSLSLSSGRRTAELFDPEDEGITVLRSGGKY